MNGPDTCGECINGIAYYDVDTPGTPHYCGGCSGYPGIVHEPTCGTEPCPNGCWDKLHPPAEDEPGACPWMP